MNQSRIFLYGKLKTLAPKGELFVATSKEMTPHNLREAVATLLKNSNPDFGGIGELNSSAIADETRILSEKEPIGEAKEFSFLPPVCGG